MKQLIFILFAALMTAASYPIEDSELDREFDIFTQNLEISSVQFRSLEMRSSNKEYTVKLVPTEMGHVAFALSDIRFLSTMKLHNMLFRIQVKGYREGNEINPVFMIDGNNERALVDSNNIFFEHINGAIPVWFSETVDSVLIEYSNSYGYDLDQYIYLDDLRVIPQIEIASNPKALIERESDRVMIAVDGSSSVDRKDRKYIYKQLKDFLYTIKANNRDSVIQIVDYGTDIYVEEIVGVDRQGKRTMRKIIKRNIETDEVRYTNWSAPLKKALVEKPKILILYTDGWSNYFEGEVSCFSSHFANLIKLCNDVKAGGTRLIFVTTDMVHEDDSNIKSSFSQTLIFRHLLNSDETQVWDRNNYVGNKISDEVELIVLSEFAELNEINIELPVTPFEQPANELGNPIQESGVAVK